MVEIGAEDAEREVRGGPAEPLVDSHAERRREESRDAGHRLQLLPHRVRKCIERTGAIRLQHHQHVGGRVRHRVLGPLGTSRPPDDVVDLGELP